MNSPNDHALMFDFIMSLLQSLKYRRMCLSFSKNHSTLTLLLKCMKVLALGKTSPSHPLPEGSDLENNVAEEGLPTGLAQAFSQKVSFLHIS